MSDRERYLRAIEGCRDQLKQLEKDRAEGMVMPMGTAREYVLAHATSEIARVEAEIEAFEWALSREG